MIDYTSRLQPVGVCDVSFRRYVLRRLAAAPTLDVGGSQGTYLRHLPAGSGRAQLGFVCAAVAYGLLLTLGGDWLVELLYRGRCAAHPGLLPILAALRLLAGINSAVGPALRDMELPDLVFWCSTMSAAVAAGLCLTLVRRRRSGGAAWALVFTQAIGTPAATVVCSHSRRRRTTGRKRQ